MGICCWGWQTVKWVCQLHIAVTIFYCTYTCVSTVIVVGGRQTNEDKVWRRWPCFWQCFWPVTQVLAALSCTWNRHKCGYLSSKMFVVWRSVSSGEVVVYWCVLSACPVGLGLYDLQAEVRGAAVDADHLGMLHCCCLQLILSELMCVCIEHHVFSDICLVTFICPQLRCDVGLEEGEYSQSGLCATVLCTVPYKGPQWYKQFWQVGRVDRVLIWLGLTLYLPSASISWVFVVLYTFNSLFHDRQEQHHGVVSLPDLENGVRVMERHTRRTHYSQTVTIKT